MRRTALVVPSILLLTAAAIAVPAVLRAEEPPPNAPKPPDTPLPKLMNPVGDAEVGETCLYSVKDLQGTRASYFEETILVRQGEWVLIETKRTDEKGVKDFGLDAGGSGWRPAGEFKDTELQKWKPDMVKDEVLYLGREGAIKAVRCTRRAIDEPDNMTSPEGPRHVRQIWYSHDVKGRGIAKMFPAQGGGERRAISWDKKVPADECKKRAEKHGAPPEEKKDTPPTPEPGMEEPGMGEPGMGEPGMTEPGMDAPGMEGK
jgi:hypothetical protein